MKATPEQQQDLLVVADIDEEIRRLQHRRSHLPEQVELDQAGELLTRVTTELIESQQRKDALTAQNQRHEREIAEVESSRKTEDARMYSGQIQSERELGALKEEIAALKRRKGDLEDSLLEIMEQLEEVDGVVLALTSRQGELEAELVALTAARDTAATDIDAGLADARARRAAALEGIASEIAAHYEALRAKRRGPVVARLQGRTCTGCQLELTGLDLEEIRRTAKTSLAYCEQCGSIIVPA